MADSFWLLRALPDPVVVHSNGRIIFGNESFNTILVAANSDRAEVDFIDWLRTVLKSKESFARLTSVFQNKASISLEIEAKIRGTLRHLTIVSCGVPPEVFGEGCQLTVFRDRSAAEAKKAYWDLHVRMSDATMVLEAEINTRKKVESELIQKSTELALLNTELNESLLELRKMQAQLSQASKMSALGEMAGGISHEINTPLAIINTLSEQLRELLLEEPLDKATIVENATVIEATVQRIAKIVSGLRSFSRDASVDQFKTESIQRIIDETLALCGERIKQHSIDLQIDEVSADLTIECRSVQISQVLLNLLNNAVDAIAVEEKKWIRLAVVEQGEFVNILVTDSGKGMPRKVQEKIFQPFFTTKEVGKGTGLGLSISRGLVGSHGGRLEIDGEFPNTRFVISLPKTQALKIS